MSKPSPLLMVGAAAGVGLGLWALLGRKPAKPKQVTVGYWSIRGLGAPLRMMVMYSGVELNAMIYDIGWKTNEDGTFKSWDGSCWFGADKPALKAENPLTNLPYVRVGDGPVISQTNACFAHVGRALGLFGNSSAQEAACEQLLCEIYDIRNTMTDFVYGATGDSKDGAAGIIKSAGGSFAKLELWLKNGLHGAGGAFLVGGSATAPDFHLFEMLDQYTAIAAYHNLPSPLADMPNLAAFHKKFAALPGNQKYFQSALYKLPFNNKMAGYGANPSGDKWVVGNDTWDGLNGIY